MQYVINLAKHFHNDSLYRNAFWIIAGTYTMAGIGFFYWLIAARLYSPTHIGLATTFISIASLISGLATLGLNTSLIKFLPTYHNKEKIINTVFTLLSISSLILGFIFIWGLPLWSNKILFLRGNLTSIFLIFIFFPFNTLNGISDSIFVALKKSKYVFISNVIQSVVKLIALIVLTTLGVWGIIGSVYFSVVFALLFSLFSIIISQKIKLKVTLDQKIVNTIRSYSLGNYLNNFIGSLPGYILPLLITNFISPEQTAFFYIPNMIATLLGVFPSTIARSYFTESSHKGIALPLKKPILLSYFILIPIVVFLFFFGKYILNFFGQVYSMEGYSYLIIISFSVLCSVINYFLGTRLLVQNQLKKIIHASILSTSVNLIFSLILIPMGINGIAIASIISHFAATLYYFIDYKKT